MDYAEARAAFFAPREAPVAPVAWDSPARRLRDTIEPLATICFWSEPAYEAYATAGLDFLAGYVWSRGSAVGDADPAVVAAAFGVFEPGLISSVVTDARRVCSLADIRRAKLDGVTAALAQVLGEPGADVVSATATLRTALSKAPTSGRPMFAGLAALDWPTDGWGALWHACTLARELRGDGHLGALAAAGLDGVQANIVTERWVGWEPLAYSASRAWSPEQLEQATAGLQERGLLTAAGLTPEGVRLRESVEQATDTSVAVVLDALAPDLDVVLPQLAGWAEQVVDSGWFPPDPAKRAAG